MQMSEQMHGLKSANNCVGCKIKNSDEIGGVMAFNGEEFTSSFPYL
jgi:hypothetical protein